MAQKRAKAVSTRREDEARAAVVPVNGPVFPSLAELAGEVRLVSSEVRQVAQALAGVERAVREVGLALVARPDEARPAQAKKVTPAPEASAPPLEKAKDSKAPTSLGGGLALVDVQRAMLAHVARGSASATRELLRSRFGVEKTSALRPEQYAAAKAALEE